MAKEATRDKPESRQAEAASERHPYGPRPVAALLPRLLRPAFRRRSPASYQLLADWELIVGPELAAVSTPRKLAGGRLVIGCTGPAALELQHRAAVLLARINTHLGAAVVTSLRFRHDGPVAASPPPVSHAPPEAAAAAARAVETLPPGPLRDALEALGRAVLSRPAS
jgi:hypothetical protein